MTDLRGKTLRRKGNLPSTIAPRVYRKQQRNDNAFRPLLRKDSRLLSFHPQPLNRRWVLDHQALEDFGNIRCSRSVLHEGSESFQQFRGQAFNVVNSAVCESSEVWRRSLPGTLLLDILGGAGDLAGVADRPPLVDEVVTSACDDSARCWFALASCKNHICRATT